MNDHVIDAALDRQRAASRARFSISADTANTTSMDIHRLHVEITPAETEEVSTSRWARLGFNPHLHLPALLLVGSYDARAYEIIARVDRYVDYCAMPQHEVRPLSEGLVAFVSAFATENMSRLPLVWYEAPAAFSAVELVDERDARAQRLLAELQNGTAHGHANVQRLRDLEAAAKEDGEPFSLDALEALVLVANAYPHMPVPDLTLSRDGAILAEWRRPALSLALYFVSPANVQYLVKRDNPLHPALRERSSGGTSADRLQDALKDVLPSL
jgi:hypothetical protein